MAAARAAWCLLPALVLWTALAAPASAQPAHALQPDEAVMLFPTAGHLDSASGEWVVPLSGWIFELEPESLWRGALLRGLAGMLNLNPAAAESAIFRQRARYFLADSERGKRLALRLLDRVVELPTTGEDGRFEGEARLDVRDLPARPPHRLTSAIVLPAGDGRRFGGVHHLLPPAGLSVLSDIDDTIKQSAVADRRALLQNTFLEPFAAVPGMATAYRRWAAAGAAFHYLSASPWQLYPMLAEFLAESDFPAGSVRLKEFRVKDDSCFNLFAAPGEYKVPAIEALLQRYPRRRFVLVGDSGEKDPEIYGEIARRFPEQIKLIVIRALPAAAQPADRYDLAFQGLARNRWRLFYDAAELKSLVLTP